MVKVYAIEHKDFDGSWEILEDAFFSLSSAENYCLELNNKNNKEEDTYFIRELSIKESNSINFIKRFE
jgi:hypothetical protein